MHAALSEPASSTSSSPAKSLNTAKTERLMQANFDGQADLSDLAAREKLSLTRLASWAHEPLTLLALEGLCRLNDARAQLLVSRYRTLAAAKLFELAKTPDQPETARKACVDLLKTSLVTPLPVSAPEASPNSASASAPLSPQDLPLLRALLAEFAHPASSPSSPTSPPQSPTDSAASAPT